MAMNSEFTPIVRRLCCLRGVSTLTGSGLAVEIGDWHRFTGSTIGAHLGLVPTESSPAGSGRRDRSGVDAEEGVGSRTFPDDPGPGARSRTGSSIPDRELDPGPCDDHSGDLVSITK